MSINSSINLSWEWILGIFITVLLIFLGWIIKQISSFKKGFEQRISNLKKGFEERIRFLENENSNKNAKINLLEKIILKPFEKGESKHV